MMPCSSGNSPTMPVTRSALASSAARSASDAVGAGHERHQRAGQRLQPLARARPACRARRGTPPGRASAGGSPADLAVLVPEEPGVRQPGAQHALVAGDDRRAAVAGLDVGDQRRSGGASAPSGVAQGEVLLVGAHGGDQHLGRQVHEGLVDAPSSGTGHSTRPVTSSSSAVVGDREALGRRQRSRAARDRCARRSAPSRTTLALAQLVHVVGEVAHRERARAPGSGGRGCASAGRDAADRRTAPPRRRAGTGSTAAAAPSGTRRRPSASTSARAARAITPGSSSARSSARRPAALAHAARTGPRPSCPRAPRACSRGRPGRAGSPRAPAPARRRAGPCARPTRSACCSGRPSTTRVSRRGVAKSCDRLRRRRDRRPSARRRRSARQVLARPSCMRAGISSESSSSSSSAIAQACAEMTAGAQPGLGAGLGQRAHAADVGGALGHADHAARVEQVEQVAGLQALVVGRQRQRRAPGSAGSGCSASAKCRNSSSVSATSKLKAEYSRSACRKTSP